MSTDASTSRATANPYLGPQAFRRGDAMYGRDRETADLLDLLIAERVVLLHSPSGAGKSSLIAAGIVGQLEQAGFEVLPVVRITHEPPPGSILRGPARNRYALSTLLSLDEGIPIELQHTLDELDAMTVAAYLAAWPDLDERPGNEVLIFDQFEEIITADHNDQDVKAAFFADIGTALRDRRLWALFSIREDFLAELDPYARLVPTRFTNRYRLDLLRVDQALEAMVRPAADRGVDFRADAAEKLVDDLRRIRVQRPSGVTEELGPTVEPVQLQVVCRQLWNRMSETHQAIDLEDVEAVGNVDQALATYYADCVGATAVETGVSERTIRDWFEHELVTPEGIRGQVLRGPQETGAAGQRAVRLLTDAHLVRAESRHGATWYELAHDRLIEPVVDDNARWREEHLTDLERLASWWDQNRRPDQALLAASDIDGAEQWMTANTDAVSQVEREFVAASREAAEQAERERRANRRTRRWLIVAVVGCVLAAGFAGWAGLAQRRAEDLSAATEVTALAGRAADAAAFDIDLSLLLARRAASDPDGAASDRTIMTSLQRAVDQSPVVTVLRGHGPATDVDYSANGQVIATSHIGASDDGSVVVWDVSSGKGQALTPPKAGLVGDSLDLSPDGSQVAAVASNGNIVTWDLSAADPAPASIVAHEHNDPYRIAYSPDGSRIASVGHSPGLAVVDLTGRPKPAPGAAPWRGGRPRDFGTADSDTVDGWDVDWTPDGEQLIVAEADGVVSVWDGGTGQHLRDLHDHETTPNAVDVSGSGTLVASATDALVVVNDIATGEVVYRWDNVGGTSDISFSSDWTRLVVTDEFGTAAVVDPSASAVLRWVTATGSSLVSVDVDPSNPGRAVVASESGDPAVWNVSAGHSQVMSDAEPLPGGGVVTTSYDGSVTLWSPDLYPTPLAAASSRDSIEDAAVSESGGLLAVARSSGAVEVWTLPGGRQRLARRFGEGSARSVSLSPDGRYVAAGGSNGSVLVWDIDASRVLHRLEEMHTQPVVSLDLGTDSGELVSASPDGTAVIWDLEARPQRRVIRLASAPDVVAWSRSGTTVAVAGEDGMLQFIDPDSGRQRPLHDAASEGHARTVHDIAFDVSGDRLVSGGADNAVIVWDVTSRRATTQYQHSAPAYRVAFSEDGQQVLVTDTSQIPHVVYLDRGELLEAAEKKVARTLTPQECDRYLGDDADCPRSE